MRTELVRRLKRYSGRILMRGHRARLLDFWHRGRIRQVLAMTDAEKAACGVKRTVRLIGAIPGLWQRTIEQTPKGLCQWGGTLFVASGPADHYLVLNSSVGVGDFAKVARECRNKGGVGWGLHMEPPGYIRGLGYDDAAEHAGLSRFYTTCPELIASGGIYRGSPPYVHFHSGRSWDFLDRAPCPRKRPSLTIITSDVDTLAGHKLRLKFLRQIDESKLECTIWGRGYGLLGLQKYRGFTYSKWSAYAPNQYAIVVENTVAPLYWTEKVADALLAFTFPFYYGSPSLGRYLPQGAFQPIDIEDGSCLKKIERDMEMDLFSQRYPQIVEARRKILDRENLYAFIDREMSEREAAL